MFDKSYDFIVVGGGPAGCTVASRLAESNSRPSVLLMEAGGDNADLELRIEANKFTQHSNPPQAWGYMSEPCPALSGRTIPLARGKGVGGCTSINF
jgi:choline dehydrogenase-like flavoprotein